MPSLLLFVVLLSIITSLISTLGAPAINQLLWSLYTRLPTPLHNLVQKNAVLRREVFQLRTQLSGISAQDDFAKWAKIRRVLDKKNAELEASQTQLTTLRSAFDSRAGILRWFITTGLRMFIQFWFSKQPMFWLPQGAVPSYAEWVLSFPRAPRGSVSIQVWGFATGQMVSLLFAIIEQVYGSFFNAAAAPPVEEPMKMAAAPVTPAKEVKKGQ
ncbi:protein get1 [Ascodesmis nigricans]|uniref:Protein get1 n=1 Tax=Ascodesmis nigricans TaxID=341454 RepID=A0A4S2MLQ7_9PEZI|nr:protein get1 [Ascodesmis nigricans]